MSGFYIHGFPAFLNSIEDFNRKKINKKNLRNFSEGLLLLQKRQCKI